jgi:hypothetical protein
VPGTRLDLNPFGQRPGTARVIRNFVPERSRFLRKSYAPQFQVAGSSSRVWHIVDFRYHRASAPESMLLVFRADGKIYRRTAGTEAEIFPGVTSHPVLNARPAVVVLGNRLFFSDNSLAYVYDGRTFRKWGIDRPSAPTVSVDATGSGITAAGGLYASVTWVVLDEEGNRVHESSCSDSSAISAALTDDELRVTTAAVAAPAGVTHWSAYISELNASGVRRRAATTAITGTGASEAVDIASLPALTYPLEPIRNDPPSASTVMGQWKHRIAMRKETDPRSVWFTGFGEVNSTNAGCGEESVPGMTASSISDLVNEFKFPASKTKLIIQHENTLHCFTEEKGHAIIGTGGVLDDLGSRDLQSAEQFPEGGCGPTAGCSTPFGLAWMTLGRKINLWPGGTTLINIGDPLKPLLDTIPEADLWLVDMKWWDGNGRKWLCMTVNAKAPDESAVAQRLLIYDFDLASEPNRPGEWNEYTEHPYCSIGTYMDGEQRFLLAGDTAGCVYQLDTICNPAHLNRSAILGQTYLGATVQNNPAATLRTGLLSPNEDKWATALYITYNRGDQVAPKTTVGTSPVVTVAVDTENPDTAPTLTLTSGTADTSGEQEAWFIPESGGVEGGALGKQFQVDLSYAAGASNNAETDGRTTVALDALYKVGFSWIPQQERTL